MSELDQYRVKDKFYRFPDFATAWRLEEGMEDDAYFSIEKREDSDLLARVQKVLR